MKASLSGMKVAVLVANRFCQDDLVKTQRYFAECGANVRIVSSEQGLVNGWQDDSWGHHFAVNTALSADFDALVVPSGRKSADKLRLTAHTKRFLNGFISMNKPVCVFDDAVNMLVFTDNIKDRTVCCPDDMMDMVTQAGGHLGSKNPCMDGDLMTCSFTGGNREEMVRMAAEFFSGYLADDMIAA